MITYLRWKLLMLSYLNQLLEGQGLDLGYRLLKHCSQVVPMVDLAKPKGYWDREPVRGDQYTASLVTPQGVLILADTVR